MIIAETPYRPVIQAETKPFRNLLLSFFFISVGLSLDLSSLAQHWAAMIAIAILFITVKIATNAASSLIFRWSVPGSMQLGFLLAQGSEFAFVILSLPAMRRPHWRHGRRDPHFRRRAELRTDALAGQGGTQNCGRDAGAAQDKG